MSGTGGMREIKWVRRRDGIKRRHGSEVNGKGVGSGRGIVQREITGTGMEGRGIVGL
jgi:hypothetical protein